MELFVVLQINFQVTCVVAPCRLENNCLGLGVTNLPSKCLDSTIQTP